MPHARRSFRSIFIMFVGLGFATGVWSVLVEDLRRSLDLSTAALGVALAVTSLGGLAAGLVGLRRVDRVPLRRLAVAGPSAVALGLAALTAVDSYTMLLAVLVVYGVATTVYDVAANTLGAAYERRSRTRIMTHLHAGFGLGAAAGALTVGAALHLGASYRMMYVSTGVALATIAAHVRNAPLPDRPDDDAAAAATPSLLRRPGVAAAVALVALAYFGDSALEGYTSTYLRDTLAAGPLLGGTGLATFYAATAVGCALGGTFVQRLGEPRTIALSGALVAVGLGLVVLGAAIVGLLLVGVASAPLVPLGYSIGTRAAGDRGASVVALITTVGYTAFLAAPLQVGLLSAAVSLRAALATLVAPALLIGAIGLWAGRRTRW